VVLRPIPFLQWLYNLVLARSGEADAEMEVPSAEPTPKSVTP